MASARQGSNRSRTWAFRNEVLLHLHSCGLLDAKAAPVRLPSETVREAGTPGDIIGLPWTLAVRNEVTMDLSGALDEVRREAAYEGKELYASIQSRRNRPIDESYVTMPLSVFVQVLG